MDYKKFWERKPRDKSTAGISLGERASGYDAISPNLNSFLLEEESDLSVLRGQTWGNIWTQSSAQQKETFPNNQAQACQQWSC